MLPGPTCPACVSFLGPFLARLPWSTCPHLLPSHWSLLYPSHASLFQGLLPCPHCPWPIQSICASGQYLPLALSTPFSIQQPNKPMSWSLPASLPRFPLLHTELLLLPCKPCALLHYHTCWFPSSFSSRQSPGSPLPTALESCGSLGMAHCLLLLYKMSLCLR